VEIKALPHGQVVLPLEICRQLGIEAGMRLEIDLDKKTCCSRLRPVHYAFSDDGELGQGVRPRQEAKTRRNKSKADAP